SPARRPGCGSSRTTPERSSSSATSSAAPVTRRWRDRSSSSTEERDAVPDLGFYHPIVIHFAIGLLSAGVVLRWVSLTRRGRGAGRAAAGVILAATVATLVAAHSGEDAHVAVEALPGISAPVRAHQTWGERTRNLVLAVGVLELLALRWRARVWTLRLTSAGIGLAAVLAALETGKLGGELVYAHARGAGIRSGDPAPSPAFSWPAS